MAESVSRALRRDRQTGATPSPRGHTEIPSNAAGATIDGVGDEEDERKMLVEWIRVVGIVVGRVGCPQFEPTPREVHGRGLLAKPHADVLEVDGTVP